MRPDNKLNRQTLQRKEDEEAKARQMMTSDILSFCVHLLQSLLSLIIALIYQSNPDPTIEVQGNTRFILIESPPIN